MSSNLNNRITHTDTVRASASGVTVYFDNIEDAICNFIRESEEVVGCVAWLKSRRIISALQGCPCTLVVTSDRVHRAARAILSSLPHRSGLRAVSVVGLARGRFRPLMHNKFIVMMRNGTPRAVITGSFNFTAHSNANLENVVRIDDASVARAYYTEAMSIYDISRRL